ncbi:MAG: carboxymuconolactone decarboxylase [Elusimicrobia bacterium CG11_big_fil_rev_8_21_14_0_20_64_6]|nr:MAG: carboxymuconolactone decarboxylase [Elusimicrobia bacterium CG11_big_fil_rev_8_21_14_0_20_64_6]
MDYKTYAVEDAPAGSKELLAAAKKNYGFVPNLLGTMAEAPSLLKAYMTLSGIFEESSFDAAERQVVLLAVSRENGCEYCVAAHTVIASMQKVPADVAASVRSGGPIGDRKLEALRAFAAAVVESRGRPSEAQAQAFLSAGYEKRQILEVVLGVGLKTLSNYTNHIAATQLDGAFAQAAWSRQVAAKA